MSLTSSEQTRLQESWLYNLCPGRRGGPEFVCGDPPLRPSCFPLSQYCRQSLAPLPPPPSLPHHITSLLVSHSDTDRTAANAFSTTPLPHPHHVLFSIVTVLPPNLAPLGDTAIKPSPLPIHFLFHNKRVCCVSWYLSMVHFNRLS